MFLFFVKHIFSALCLKPFLFTFNANCAQIMQVKRALFTFTRALLLLLSGAGDEEMLSLAKAHGVTEADHLKQIEHWLEKNSVCFCELGVGLSAVVQPLLWCWHDACKRIGKIETTSRFLSTRQSQIKDRNERS